MISRSQSKTYDHENVYEPKNQNVQILSVSLDIRLVYFTSLSLALSPSFPPPPFLPVSLTPPSLFLPLSLPIPPSLPPLSLRHTISIPFSLFFPTLLCSSTPFLQVFARHSFFVPILSFSLSPSTLPGETNALHLLTARAVLPPPRLG